MKTDKFYKADFHPKQITVCSDECLFFLRKGLQPNIINLRKTFLVESPCIEGIIQPLTTEWSQPRNGDISLAVLPQHTVLKLTALGCNLRGRPVNIRCT
ncbi:MAG: hypothetical protein LUG18_08300 [Candidatus Azobacteroides sp.]|nr:hypothetical protein [Candidatus Azobacteroides sp.]